eukprot:1392629-Amorphochlora_amoeboformis.AAC.1
MILRFGNPLDRQHIHVGYDDAHQDNTEEDTDNLQQSYAQSLALYAGEFISAPSVSIPALGAEHSLIAVSPVTRPGEATGRHDVVDKEIGFVADHLAGTSEAFHRVPHDVLHLVIEGSVASTLRKVWGSGRVRNTSIALIPIRVGNRVTPARSTGSRPSPTITGASLSTSLTERTACCS